MAIKPGDLLNQLPSVSELLEKPPIRTLAARWNRSVVAGRVRSFLDEMRSELQRRAGEVPMPSVRELAERAARYVVSRQQWSLGSAINASGQLRGAPWMSRPLSDAALERMVAVGREFILEASPATGTPPLEVKPLLCRLTGAEAAAAVHSYSGALWLVLSALAAKREVLVARAEVGEIDLAEPLPQLAAAADASLVEVGTINRASVADYRALASPRAAALLKICHDAYRVVGETSMATMEELVGIGRASDMLVIDALGAAPLVDLPESYGTSFRSASGSMAAGIDVAIVRGDGLLGGPPCGVLVGRRQSIDRIARHPLFAALRLDVPRAAALVATLEAYDNQPLGPEELPAWQFLFAPVENLRSRAERMAQQLAHMNEVGSSTAIETRSHLYSALADGFASYGVALTAADGDIASLDERLRSATVPILGRIEGDRLILDLRTVLPRQDKALVDALLGTPSESRTESTDGEQSGSSYAGQPA